MTSFAFILGVAPLVVASGAGASARKSIGITVFSGMIASTCLAVLFVPTFFVVIQRFEYWLAERRGKTLSTQTTAPPRPDLTLLLHLDHPLAAVFAGEQSDQGLRRIFKAIDNVLLDFQLAGGHP